jgi:hypothetical protein
MPLAESDWLQASDGYLQAFSPGGEKILRGRKIPRFGQAPAARRVAPADN